VKVAKVLAGSGSQAAVNRSLTESCLERLSNRTAASLAWLGRAIDSSAIIGAVSSLQPRVSDWVRESLAARFFSRFFEFFIVPAGQGITEGTLLGIVLALGAFVPTEIQMLGLFALVSGLAWMKSKARSLGQSWCRLAPSRIPLQLILPFVLLFMFLTGATISSVVPARSLKNLALWCCGGLAFFLAYHMTSRGNEDGVVWPFLAGTSLSSLVGIYQHFSGWQPPRSWLDEKFEEEIVRVVGTFQNPNYFAEMLGLALPVTLALLIRQKSLRDRAVLVVFAIVQGLSLVYTWSRGSWLGFIASFGIMAILLDKRLLVLGLVVSLVGVTLAPPVLVQRLLSSFSVDDSSNSYRISIWRGSISILRKYIFRGVGLGAEAFSEMYPEHMIIQTPALHSHSVYFQMLIELGLLGFLTLLWFLGANVWYSLRVVFRAQGGVWEKWTKTGVLAGCLAAVAGNMLHGVIEHTWYNPQVMMIVWAWLGVASGVATKESLIKRAPAVLASKRRGE
jgi:putative inorganic carbon (HCO3(-)) transporter